MFKENVPLKEELNPKTRLINSDPHLDILSKVFEFSYCYKYAERPPSTGGKLAIETELCF